MYSHQALRMMDADPGPWRPEEILFTHSRLLRTVGQDAEADEYLSRAHERVRLVADNVQDEDLRRSWLEDVAINRTIVAAAQKD